MAGCDVLGSEFVSRLEAYENAASGDKTQALQDILELVDGDGAGAPLQLGWVVGSATAEQWARKWSNVNASAIAKILGSSQVSQEGCLAIEVAARYIKMFRETSKTIRVHAMLIWNGFLEREWRRVVRARAAGVETVTVPSAQAFVLVPLACLLLACKLSGRSRVVPNLEYVACVSMSVCQALYGTHEGMDGARVQEAKDALRNAENRVLRTMAWEVDLMLEIEEALETVEFRRLEIATDGL